MKNKKQAESKRSRNKYTLFIILLFVVIVISSILGAVTGMIKARAEESTTDKYTGVIEDLSKDESFDPNDYPAVADDHGIRVIQIAESTDRELFVYTYQPSQNEQAIATSVRLSTEKNNVDSRHDYSLILCDHSGTLYKYKVEGLTVVDEAVRYYDITAVFRKWLSGIDDETGNDNTVDQISYAVGQLWTVVEIDGEIKYMLQDIEVVVVTDKYVDFLRYKEGFRLFKNEFCDSHYVAFSTDHDIDTLMKAKVSFISGEYWSPGDLTKLSAKDLEILEQANSIRPNGQAQEYEVKFNSDDLTKQGAYRIESVDSFIEKEDLTDKVKELVKPKEWVLRFCETPVQVNKYGPALNPAANKSYFMRVSEVTILELTFETDGIVYDLGVVDNRQTGDLIAGNDKKEDPFEWLKKLVEWLIKNWHWIVIGIVALFALVILMPFMPSILGLVVKCVVWFFKGLWWLLSLPIRGIAALVEKIRDKADGG